MGAKITLSAILSLKIGKFWYFAIEVCSLWFDWWKVIIIEKSNYLRHKMAAKLQTKTLSEILHSFDSSLNEVCSLGYDWWEVITGLVYVSPVQHQVIIWTKNYWIQYCKHAALGEDELIYPKLLIICAPYLTCEAKILNIERCSFHGANSLNLCHLPPVALTIFQSNSKFNQNLPSTGLKCTLLITMKYCTCPNGVTVVTGAKFFVISWAYFKVKHFKFLSNFAFDQNTLMGQAPFPMLYIWCWATFWQSLLALCEIGSSYINEIIQLRFTWYSNGQFASHLLHSIYYNCVVSILNVNCMI